VIEIIGNNLEFRNPPNPYWIASTPETNYPVLNEDIKVDIAIVGGGMTGITAAYMLVKEGLKVAVVEGDRILHGTTGHTTAKITSQHELIYARLKRELGSELAQQYADANEKAIRTIADIIKENNIDCDFEPRTAYVYTQQDKYVPQIEEEAQVAKDFGIKASVTEEVSLPFAVKAALCFEEQAQFHPLKYLQALLPVITDAGSHIFENTQAINIEEDKSCTVVTRDGKKIESSAVIIASHYPFFDGGGLYFARVWQEKSYVVAITATGKYPEGMFISAEDPARSLRTQKCADGELILIGGEHHKSGQSPNTNSHYKNLIDFAQTNFDVINIPYRWSTQDCMTLDGVPYVGYLTSRSQKLYVATGFGKWGMTNSTVAATIIKDLITKGESPWAPVYNPSRFNLASTGNLIVQNANVAVNYISGKLKPALDNAQIAVGEANVIKVDDQKVGAYRDENGLLHVVDITCPHLGCELSWNEAETTWDCPCHGSRFTYEGNLVEGPALNGLNHPDQGHNKVEPNVYQ
jgi:glycine/D-amino acid oxidase-like deaminating enzyme/nitrite reductase/ring-hydroxylating ferredoxin subunit